MERVRLGRGQCFGGPHPLQPKLEYPSRVSVCQQCALKFEWHKNGFVRRVHFFAWIGRGFQKIFEVVFPPATS